MTHTHTPTHTHYRQRTLSKDYEDSCCRLIKRISTRIEICLEKDAYIQTRRTYVRFFSNIHISCCTLMTCFNGGNMITDQKLISPYPSLHFCAASHSKRYLGKATIRSRFTTRFVSRILSPQINFCYTCPTVQKNI
jgi:hypothetical protein